MESVEKIVYYCCISNCGRILYAYDGGDHDIENLAALCLERTPPYHQWYFQTMARKTFGFLMEDDWVYFTIVNRSVANGAALSFLERLKDEYKVLARKSSRRSMSNMSSISLQEQLDPVVLSMITSLERVSGMGTEWPEAKLPSPDDLSLSLGSCSGSDGQIVLNSSTRAPLLGNCSKHEKKKLKDHAIAIRDTDLEEHRKSTEKGARTDSGSTNTNSQGGTTSPASLQKEFGSGRYRSGSHNLQKRWCRQVRIVLAIDAAVCLVLFFIWLIICKGTQCLR